MSIGSIDLLKPVTVQMAEAMARKMREIQKDPANGILPLPQGPEAFRAPASPVPQIQTRLDMTHHLVPNMPTSAFSKGVLLEDPRMWASATAGASPNDIQYWKRIRAVMLKHEELRRVLQRDGWSRAAAELLVEKHARVVADYALELDRKKILRIKDERAYYRFRINIEFNKRAYSRDELEAFIALVNRDRVWVENLMIGRAREPRIQTDKQNLELQKVEKNFLDRERMSALQRDVDDAAVQLAGWQGAIAYHIFKKTG